jgi:RimJ/RimL family protein N-acetyltransferase
MNLRLPPLQTRHLIVRDLILDDLESVHQIVDRESGFDPFTLEERRHWLEWSMMSYAAFASLYQPPWGDRGVILKATNDLIGVVGYTTLFHPLTEILEGKSSREAHLHPEMGLFYAISRDHRRQGYAQEAAQALINFAFENFNLKRIVANTDFDNAASQAVMKKLGMTLYRNETGVPDWYEVLGVLENKN